MKLSYSCGQHMLQSRYYNPSALSRRFHKVFIIPIPKKDNFLIEFLGTKLQAIEYQKKIFVFYPAEL